MHTQFPDLATLSLKRNLKLGARMEVYTLTCIVYHHMIQKDERSFTLTRLSRKGSVKNQPQWEHFKELCDGKFLVAFSFWEFEEFWPSDMLQSFYTRTKKNILELSGIASLFVPGKVFQSAVELSDFLTSFVPSDDSPPDDPIFRLFNDLSVYVSSLDLKSRQDIAAFLSFEYPAITSWLEKLGYAATHRSAAHYTLPDNIRKAAADSPDTPIEASDEAIRAIFSEEGVAGQIMPGFEKRPEQIKFARMFLDALKKDEYLLAEGGTGTGKSLAYLVPSLMYNLDSDARVVVSTYTRNLQNQLFFNDLVQAEKLVGSSFSSLLLKGRTNYLCLLKMHIARANAVRTFDSKQLAEFASVLIYKDITTSGDLSELGGLSPAVRNEIACDAAFCRKAASRLRLASALQITYSLFHERSSIILASCADAPSAGTGNIHGNCRYLPQRTDPEQS